MGLQAAIDLAFPGKFAGASLKLGGDLSPDREGLALPRQIRRGLIAHSSDTDHPFRSDADHRFHAFRSPSRSEATRVSHYGVK